jgi:hypothetical protein
MNKFDKFCKELNNLSLQYGIVIQSVGGVMVCDPTEIIEIEYNSDLTSGDLIPEIKWRD